MWKILCKNILALYRWHDFCIWIFYFASPCRDVFILWYCHWLHNIVSTWCVTMMISAVIAAISCNVVHTATVHIWANYNLCSHTMMSILLFMFIITASGIVSASQWIHGLCCNRRPQQLQWLVSGHRHPAATVVSAESFSHGTGTLRCLQKEMATYRHWSVSLWRDPDDVSHCRILSPDKTEWRLISATLCGWRRCFVADQLWLMTRIRKEDHCEMAALNECTQICI